MNLAAAFDLDKPLVVLDLETTSSMPEAAISRRATAVVLPLPPPRSTPRNLR